MSLDLVIFARVFKCPKCKGSFLEESFTRDSRDFWHGGNAKFCKNMCNACFAKDKEYDCTGYDTPEERRETATNLFVRYERKVREASEPSRFTSSEIASFSKKMHVLYAELKKRYPTITHTDEMWMSSEDNSRGSRDAMKYREEFGPMFDKITSHWAWNYEPKSTTNATEKKSTLDVNTMKYVNRFKDASDPTKEATKYREEYKKQYYEVEERMKFYEIEAKNAKNFPGQKLAMEKMEEKKEIMTMMITNIESLKKTINYFTTM